MTGEEERGEERRRENKRQLKVNWAGWLRRQLMTVEPGEAELSQEKPN